MAWFEGDIVILVGVKRRLWYPKTYTPKCLRKSESNQKKKKVVGSIGLNERRRWWMDEGGHSVTFTNCYYDDIWIRGG